MKAEKTKAVNELEEETEVIDSEIEEESIGEEN